MACRDNSWCNNIHKHRVHDKLRQEKREYHSIYCTYNRKEITMDNPLICEERHLTVANLIEILNTLPPDAEVYLYSDAHTGCGDFIEVSRYGNTYDIVQSIRVNEH